MGKVTKTRRELLTSQWFTNHFLLIAMIIQECVKPSTSINGLIWSKNNKTFVSILSIPEYRNLQQRYSLKIQETEKHDFGGQVFNFTYFEDKNFVNFEANDSKVTGAFADVWNLLGEYLNFTLNPIKYEEKSVGATFTNGTFSGLLNIIAQNKTNIIPKIEMYTVRLKALEFTTPFWKSSYRLYVRRKRKHDITWMMKLCTNGTWYSTIMIYVLFCLTGFLSQIICSTKKHHIRYYDLMRDHFFYNLGMIFNQSHIPNSLTGRPKMIELSLGLFTNVFRIAFSAFLFNYMSKKFFLPPFSSLNTMYHETNYDVIVLRGSIGYIAFEHKSKPIYQILINHNRVKYVDTVEEMYELCCLPTKKYSILDDEDRKKTLGQFGCGLSPTGQSYFTTWMASGISQGMPNKRSFDIGITKLREFGILQVLRERWIETSNVEEIESLNPEPLNMQQLAIIFGVVYGGIIVAILILLLEIAVSIFSHKLAI